MKNVYFKEEDDVTIANGVESERVLAIGRLADASESAAETHDVHFEQLN